ncbi:tRNA (cytidine(56)-2'-O)-methyltransferase [Candidatus Woesearchaeota archaeon]|nr:tRNA (cytidine(56)-2'-O)-methyltransferase [Candidatus Woesearchaeota archaeon]
MIEVLRLTHRIRRDPRLSSHVALTARAFLADKIYYSGDRDSKFESSINNTVNRFGGPFEILYVEDALKFVKKRKENGFLIIHTTMYGLKLDGVINKIKASKNILIIIGSERVEPGFYELSDYNVSVTNQPHSEVAALAVFLHMLKNGEEFDHKFKDSKLTINPDKAGKVVVEKR